MQNLKRNLQAVARSLPVGVTLVAVSKHHPAEAVREAYDAGQRVFGESYALELKEKHDVLPRDIEWHFIGHLQTNKVKYIIPFVSLIHSIDSVRLLNEVDRQAAVHGRVVDCLLQVHVAQEETKFGFTPEECLSVVSDIGFRQLGNVRIRGVMAMASNTDDESQISEEFRRVKKLFDTLRTSVWKGNAAFDTLSMGMSADYELAIGMGSNMVRIGSRIFGERNYLQE
ncbi:MAG: YggS family pyridoxal phosphate-dependent enzyme [Bacteroidales bacterium]|nr:YggS family pyridoxal phosphate-dependent enzyme [Bacteroidales bacterium]